MGKKINFSLFEMLKIKYQNYLISFQKFSQLHFLNTLIWQSKVIRFTPIASLHAILTLSNGYMENSIHGLDC